MRPIVFLHGFLGNSGEWQRVIAALPNQSRCRSLDLPVTNDWHDAVQAVLAKITTPSVLIGYSMGARLALGCAVAASQKVSHLYFVSGNPGLDDAERAPRWTSDQAVAERLLTEPVREFLESWYQQPVFSSVPDAMKSQWIDERQADMDRTRQSKLLSSLSVAKQPNYWEDLASLSCPITVIVGEQDEKYKSIGQAITQQSRARLEIIKNAGHAVHRERPLEVARILQSVNGPPS